MTVLNILSSVTFKMNNTTDDPSLVFYGKDPGAAKFGNFINYYSFHSVNERIQNLHRDMFPLIDNTSPLLILDIGCNTGELTIQLYRYIKSLFLNTELHILAIDIDPILIERANREIESISFITCNIVNKKGQKTITEYLEKFNKKTFDITFCFSVTMWIHLNNGDDLFMEFLKFLKTYSICIIIEPQPWKCYKNANRRMKRAGAGDFQLFHSLKITLNVEDVIEKVLSEVTHWKVYESQSSSWNRRIQSYILKDNL